MAKQPDAVDRYLQPRIQPPPALTIGDVLGNPTTYVVPGFSTDAGGNIVTQSTLTQTQTAANTAASSGDADVDWADVYFGSYGLPSDVKNQILALGKKYGSSNPDVFFTAAQNVIRQSDWFKQTYPGFFAGVKSGLFTDETGYRNYVNSLNGVYKQYTNNAVSSADVEAALNDGVTADIVGRRFQGQAYVDTNRGDIQYLTGAFDTGPLNSDELTALGRENAGIDSTLGQQVQRRLQLASQRLQGLFQGRLATPNLTLGGNGVSAPGLLGKQSTSDVGA